MVGERRRHSALTLVVRDADSAIPFYLRVFHAQLVGDIERDGRGRVQRAELQLGSLTLFVQDEVPEQNVLSPEGGGTSLTIRVDVLDVDQSFHAAVAIGSAPVREPHDIAGGRKAILAGPFGHVWEIYSERRQELITRDSYLSGMLPQPFSK